MIDANKNTTMNDNKTDSHCAAETHDAGHVKKDNDMVKSIKHAAHVTATEAVAFGSECKAAGKEIVDHVVEDSKAAYAVTEKAALHAADNALKKTSHAADSASKSIEKVIHEKAYEKE